MLINNFHFDSIEILFSETSFEQRAVLSDHTNYVIATCYIPSTDRFPDGIIATGGNDKKICVYSAKQGTHLFTLEGHEQTGKETIVYFCHTDLLCYLKLLVYLMYHKVIFY